MDQLSSSETRRKVNQKHVLCSEILFVTSVMRKNSRWASSTQYMNSRDSALARSLGLRITSPTSIQQRSAKLGREAELMAGFQELKRAISDADDLKTIPLPMILSPFFAIIRSSLSTGPITSAALSALHSFFICNLISPTSVSLNSALIELSSTVSHCKFEASDSSGDEVVLLKIMTVIHDCLCGSVGQFLGDIEICEMLETVLTTSCQMRLSESLRRFAENTMHSLVRTVFSRLHDLDTAVEEAKLLMKEEDLHEAEIKMTVSTNQDQVSSDQDPTTPSLHSEGKSLDEVMHSEPISANTFPISEYGLPSILELLRVLINVLDPNDQQHTDSTRLVALGILNAAFEESGTRIPDFPSLESLVLDSGCKYLFQLARSENAVVLYWTLRTISTVFSTMRQHLKLQQELFLAFSIDRLAPPISSRTHGAAGRRDLTDSPRPSTPSTSGHEAVDVEVQLERVTSHRILVPPARGETRNLMLETLSHICRHPSFMVDLYINYDCDINCENMFERVIEFLSTGVSSPQHSASESHQQHAQNLCLDLLLSFVNNMALRTDGSSETWPSHFLAPEALMQSKSQKKLVLLGASRFNSKPKTGLAFLEENGLLYSDLTADVSREQSLAAFLKDCTRLDKRLLGDFISKPDNMGLLKAFIGLFDFKDKPLAEAMRELLEAFRLPGEAQQIDRITQTFAATYFASKPAEIKTEDAVYVLAFSIIMLNTDLHNPQIRKRMSFEDYQKNVRGVNDGSDFSHEFLQNIYDSIRKREIVMPEEHIGQLGFEYAWKELLARSRQAGDFMVCNSSLFDIEMFKAVWTSVISAIAYAFTHFDDDFVIQRAIAGFRQCATLAGRFHLPDVFDFVVLSLSQATSLLSDSLPARVPNYPVVTVDGQSVTVSSLSVKFGTNFKGQLAAVVLFNIVNGNGNALREGWTQIFEMFQNLFLHSLLPTRMLQMEDFLGGVYMIPLQGSQPPRNLARNDGGLLSALSSYLMTPYSASSEALLPDATDADVENTLCSIDCITSCRLDELYAQIMQLNLEALTAAVRALEALAHERTVARLKQGEDLVPSGADHEHYSLPYDPASVFLLETMVSIACQTPQHINDLWPVVFEHLSALLLASTQYSILLIERAVVGMLRLCLILTQKPLLRDQIYVSFDLLAGLPPVIASSVAEQVIAGIVLIIEKNREVVRSQTEWSLVFALVRTTLSHTEAARVSFDLISSLVTEQFVTVDNFPGLAAVLEEFAATAGVLVDTQQQKGRRAEPLTSSNSPPIARGRKAIDLLFDLQKYISPLMESSHLSRSSVWRQLCLPSLTSLSRQSTNASREIRQCAISSLQRVLLGTHIVLDQDDNTQVEEIFYRVLFPLLDDLLKPQISQRDPRGMPETRLRASALLCKTFMHFEIRESNAQSDFRVLWIQILDLLDRLMNLDKGDQLSEAVPESLKNVVLVMNAARILVPPPAENDERDDRQRTLWSGTQERIDRFLPGFLSEVISSPI